MNGGYFYANNKDEVNSVKSQFVTSPNKNFYSGQEGGRRKLPYVFTEQGIYMLATVLRGKVANITIFVDSKCML